MARRAATRTRVDADSTRDSRPGHQVHWPCWHWEGLVHTVASAAILQQVELPAFQQGLQVPRTQPPSVWQIVPREAVVQSTFPWQRYPTHLPLMQSWPARQSAPLLPRRHVRSAPRQTPLQQDAGSSTEHLASTALQSGAGLQRPLRQRPPCPHGVSSARGRQRPFLQRLQTPHFLAQRACAGSGWVPTTSAPPSPTPPSSRITPRRESAVPRLGREGTAASERVRRSNSERSTGHLPQTPATISWSTWRPWH